MTSRETIKRAVAVLRKSQDDGVDIWQQVWDLDEAGFIREDDNDRR